MVYNKLSKDDVIRIIDLQMSDLYKNLEKIGFSVLITKKAKSHLANQGFSSEYGARNLRREIQKSIEDPLSELLLRNKFKKVNKIKIDIKAGIFEFLPVLVKSKKTVISKP